jgi:hypothetical protein
MSNPTTSENTLNGPLDLPTVVPTITVGTVDAGQSAYNPPPDNTVWTDYMINNRYEGDLHRYMAGISSPNGFQGASAAFFQLAAPTVLWVCDWTALLINGPPQCPDPFSVGDDWVLLDYHLEPAMLGLAADGVSATYRLSGTYFFGQKNPGQQSNYANSVFSTAQYPRPPWLDDVFMRKIPAESLMSALITWQGSSSSQRNTAAGFSSDMRAYPGSPR